jgi:hypothetical protein
MKLYRTGIISILGFVAATITFFSIRAGFNVSQPVMFWSIQAVVLTCIVIGLCYAYYTWDSSYNVSASLLLRTAICIGMLYVMAFRPVTYGLFSLMAVLVVIHIYIVRKRFN